MSAYLPYRPRLRTIVAMIDGVALAAAAWLAHVLRFHGAERSLKWQQILESPGLLAWALLSGWAITVAAELYEPEVLLRRREVIVRVMVAVAAWSTALVLATYANPAWAFGRGLLLLTALLWLVAQVSVRWAVTARLRRRRSRFNALVVGETEAVHRFCHDLLARPSAPWQPVDGADVPLGEIPSSIEALDASIVILAGGHNHQAEMAPALTALHFSGVPVVAASEIWAWLEERLPLEALTPGLFLHQPGFGAVHWTLFNRLTRIADIVLALLMGILALPLFFTAALAVLLVDGGPVLYRQQRVGQYGRKFTLLKLRTMRRNAEADGPTFATTNDPRTIRGGKLLRRFRIDELPQLLNILKGEMSLVGPRPERPEFVTELTEKIPYYSFRLAVPPGLTGWAQVNTGYAASVEDHGRKLEFDLYFIRERSLRLYLLTLLRTASAALVGVHRKVYAPAGDEATETEPETHTSLDIVSKREATS